MKQYRNLFAECGYSQEEIDQKVQDTWNKLFMDDAAAEKIYYTDDMGGYIFLCDHAQILSNTSFSSICTAIIMP